MNPYEPPKTASDGRRKGLPMSFKLAWVLFSLCFVPAAGWFAGVLVWTWGFNTHRIGMETLAKLTTLAVVLSGLAGLVFCVGILGWVSRRVRSARHPARNYADSPATHRMEA